MVPLRMPLVTHDASANGGTRPKSHVAPHFNCLNVRNAMKLWMTLYIPHDANNGPKTLCCTSFLFTYLTEGMQWSL